MNLPLKTPRFGEVFIFYRHIAHVTQKVKICIWTGDRKQTPGVLKIVGVCKTVLDPRHLVGNPVSDSLCVVVQSDQLSNTNLPLSSVASVLVGMHYLRSGFVRLADLPPAPKALLFRV